MACWLGYRRQAWQAGIGRRHIKRSVAGRSMYIGWMILVNFGWMDLARHRLSQIAFKETTVSTWKLRLNISTGCTSSIVNESFNISRSLANVAGSQEI